MRGGGWAAAEPSQGGGRGAGGPSSRGGNDGGRGGEYDNISAAERVAMVRAKREKDRELELAEKDRQVRNRRGPRRLDRHVRCCDRVCLCKLQRLRSIADVH